MLILFTAPSSVYLKCLKLFVSLYATNLPNSKEEIVELTELMYENLMSLSLEKEDRLIEKANRTLDILSVIIDDS